MIAIAGTRELGKLLCKLSLGNPHSTLEHERLKNLQVNSLVNSY